MSEFEIQPSELPMNEPNKDQRFKNVKEIKIGDGTFSVKEGVLKVGEITVIDEKGLNSLENFRSDTVFDGTNRTQTSLTYTDIPGAALIPFTLDRPARILTYLRVKTENDNMVTDGYTTQFRMYDTFDDDATDGIISGGEGLQYVQTDGAGHVTSITTRIRSLESTSISNDLYVAGTHQFKVQWKVNGGTGNLYELQMGYVILGI